MSNINQIILETAIEFMCEKHDVSRSQIIEAMQAGDQSVWNQFNQLLALGMKTAAAQIKSDSNKQ